MADRVVAELVAQNAQKFIQDFNNATRAVGGLTTSLQAAERIRTPQLAPQIQALNAALQQSRQSARDFVAQLGDLTNASSAVTGASTKKTRAIQEQGDAESRASKQGITYLSTLSAIHAASFLATGRTFSLIGSFFTLGAAFTRLGGAAVGIGLVFGGLLAAFKAINDITVLYQQVITQAAQVTLTAVGIISAATTAAGIAGVKLAADVEQGLALIQAIEAASRAQLAGLVGEAQRIALAFGVSVKDIVDASSLFTRAGGNIEDAINGATEAIVKLQVASAGELKAAEAARAIAVGLQAFSQEGRTAIQIADAVAAVAQRSALSFTEVAQAFQQAVPGSVTLGITLSDLSAIIVTLGNSALRGTVAGTSFKQFLLDLVNPSDKAAKKMAELNVSIKDADGNIRPIISIIGDLNTALEKLTPAGRAEALAEIFESRAGLAGAILSRQTVEQLQELRAELDALTVTDVVDVLLLPLNAQLQRLQVTVTELGRVFGGTLLQPIRTVTVAAIDFFQELIPLAELAGQAISVILTGQGFGALQQRISELTGDTRLAIFLTELINTFRNVRDVIINQIVPAINDFITNLGLVGSENGRLTDTVNAFAAINRAIQFLGAVTAIGIRSLSELVTHIIHNEGRGKELRDTLNSIANVIITRVVVGSAAAVAGFIILTKILEAVSNVITQHVLPNIAKVANAVSLLAQISVTSVQTIVAPWTALIRAVVTAQKVLEGADFADALVEADKAANKLEGSVAELALRPIRAVRDLALAIRDMANGVQIAGFNVEEFLETARDDANATVKSFENLTGELPTFLSNLLDEIKRIQAQARQDEDEGGAPIAIVDEKEVERVKERILEAGRDISRRLENLAEDTSTKITNIVDKALERIGDIREKLSRDLAKLDRDTKDKIDDLNESVTQRRNDRFRTDIERRQQDRRLQIIERSLEKQTEFEERQLEEVRILRQRAVEDVQRSYDLQADAVERSYSRQQAAAEAAFQAQQKAQEQALQATQSAEEKALQRQLDAASRARQESQQRAEAKTPEDKAKVEQQIARARSDRRFEEGQQSQIDALQRRHEQQRTQLQERQAAQQKAFQISQEDAALQERLKREAAALRFRRSLEAQERTIRLREEDAQLLRRIQNEDFLDGYKRTQAQNFQNFQDRLEDEATQRQKDRINRDKQDRITDLTTEAERQRGEVVDQVTQQLAEVNQTIDREIRNALQRLSDIEDSLTPDVAAAVRATLLGVQQAVATSAQGVLRGVSEQAEVGRATVGAQLQVTQPSQVATLVATTLQVTSLHLPQGFVNGITQGMFLALQEADRRGFFDSDIPQLNQLIQELRAPSPLPTRR